MIRSLTSSLMFAEDRALAPRLGRGGIVRVSSGEGSLVRRGGIVRVSSKRGIDPVPEPGRSGELPGRGRDPVPEPGRSAGRTGRSGRAGRSAKGAGGGSYIVFVSSKDGSALAAGRGVGRRAIGARGGMVSSDSGLPPAAERAAEGRGAKGIVLSDSGLPPAADRARGGGDAPPGFRATLIGTIAMHSGH